MSMYVVITLKINRKAQGKGKGRFRQGWVTKCKQWFSGLVSLKKAAASPKPYGGTLRCAAFEKPISMQQLGEVAVASLD